MLAAALGVLGGCGAKTGLLVPDASSEAGLNTGVDAGPDASICTPDELELAQRAAEVLFVVDRSNSMNRTLDDRVPEPGEETRWVLLASVLHDVLAETDPMLLEVGAEFFPGIIPDGPGIGPEEACKVSPGIDLRPGPRNVDRLLSFFETTGPDGGTPTAAALEEVRRYFESRPMSEVPRFVVLATDGGPNCNAMPSPPPPGCVCTGQVFQCDPTPPPIGVGEFAPYNCLDEDPTLAVIRDLHEELGVPVYVVGIDDPTRPDLAEVLDRMAVYGGRPRDDEDGGRRFYSVRRPTDLRGALTTITESISNCVFKVSPAPTDDAVVSVTIEGLQVPRDRTRTEGWDFTRPRRDELTLFGGACERAGSRDARVVAIVECPPE